MATRSDVVEVIDRASAKAEVARGEYGIWIRNDGTPFRRATCKEVRRHAKLLARTLDPNVETTIDGERVRLA